MAPRSVLILIVLFCCITSCNSFDKQEKSAQSDYRPNDLMFMQRAYPSGEIKSDALKKAFKWKRDLPRRKNTENEVLWEFTGPINVGGRITDIEIPLDQAQTYYVGTASGGIFKSTDAGENWSPIFDEAESLSIGDIEISKTNSNNVWVGSGEVNGGGGSLAYDGNGVSQSLDGGLSWTNKGLEETGSISRVAISPNDEQTVYVGAMGSLFKNDGNGGVFKTSNNGDSWEKVLALSDSTGIIDLAIHPSNGDILYAAAWERVRRPQYRSYGGPTSGMYRSTNGGASWEELTNGLPTAPEEKGRISLDISPSNPDVLYARYTDAVGDIQGVYRTDDGGNSWTERNSNGLVNIGYHWWFRGIRVDPTDEDVIYNLGFFMQKSTDGGNTWFESFPNVHVDHHALAFSPNNADEVLLGNDGGLYSSLNGGSSYTQFYNLPITQFYKMYADPNDSDRIYGGTQDNGTLRTTTGSIDDWNRIYGGDGFQPLVDENNGNIIYVLKQNGSFSKSYDDGDFFSNADNGIPSTERFNWNTAIAFDPQNSETLYYCTQRVWKSTDGSDTWEAISEDLSNGSGGGNLSFGTITTLDVSPIDSDVIVAGTDDSNIWITQDGGANWEKVSSTLPNLWTTRVLADKDNVEVFFASFSGYRYGENLGHVFMTPDYGSTWIDIGSNLPDIPVNDIELDNQGNLYIATDIGVFVSENQGLDWTPLDEQMPSVVVTDLHYQEQDQMLVAGTYGRSAYKAFLVGDDDTGIAGNTKDLILYPNPAETEFWLNLSNAFDDVQLYVFSSSGRLVLQDEAFSPNKSVDISNLKSGLYQVMVIDNTTQHTSKLVIE